MKLMLGLTRTETDWQRIELDRRVTGELRGLLNRYVCNLLGYRPKLYDFLGW